MPNEASVRPAKIRHRIRATLYFSPDRRMTTSLTDSFPSTEDPSRQFNGHTPDGSTDVLSSDGTPNSNTGQTMHMHTSEYSGLADATADVREARRAPESSDTRKESTIQRQARWKDKESLYSQYPLYSVLVGDRPRGILATITVKGNDIDRWLRHIDAFLKYRNYEDVDKLGLQLKTLMISLADTFPVALGQVNLREGTDSTVHPVRHLFAEAALTLWSFALNPLREYHGIKREVARLRMEFVVIWSSRSVRDAILPASTLPIASGNSEHETAESLLHLAQGPCAGVREADSQMESHVMSSATERWTSLGSSTVGYPASAVPARRASSFWLEPMSLSPRYDSRACRNNRIRWMSREKLAGGPPLYKTLPGKTKAEGNEEIAIKGKYCNYWTDRILQKCQGKDPAQLVSRLTTLLGVLKDTRPYLRDPAEWSEAPVSKVRKRRCNAFAREVALSLWIVASDFDAEYPAVAEYLGMLCERAFSHVGLNIPGITSLNAEGTGSEVSQPITGMAHTDHGESGRHAYSADVTDSGFGGEDRSSRIFDILQEISKLKKQSDRTRELTAKRTRRYYARLRAQKQENVLGSKESGSTS